MADKIKQTKIHLDSNLNPLSMYMLKKPTDPRFNKVGSQIFWLEWNENGTFKAKHTEPKVGYSLIMDPYKGVEFTWQTTDITELISSTPNKTHFKTKNSEYILTKI